MKAILKLCLALILFIPLSCTNKNEFVIADESIARVVKINNNVHILTSEILNKISGKKLIPGDKEEFRLRISPGTHIEGLDVVLSSEDFKFIKVLQEDSTSLGFLLENREHQLE